MLDESTQSAKFLTVGPNPCPYLPNRQESLEVAAVGPPSIAWLLYNKLARLGFRRAGKLVYRPNCIGCSACKSVRIRVKEFSPSRSQRRVVRKNSGLLRSLQAAAADLEQFSVFKRYTADRHADSSMAAFEYSDYSTMIEDTNVQTCLVQYHLESADNPGSQMLAAASLTDILDDGLSMVYSYFDPDLSANSVGSYMIMDHIALARELGFDHLYLGYWVQGSKTMDYKASFEPLDVYRDGRWIDRSAGT